MPRVLHVITGLTVGGAERSLYSLLQGDISSEWEHVVVSLSDVGTFGPRIERLGTEVFALGMRPGRFSFSSLQRLRFLVRHKDPDIIQGWMYHGNLVAILGRAFSGTGTALAWNIRQSLDDIAKEKWSTRVTINLGRHSSKSVDSIIYNSHRSRSVHEACGFSSSKSVVIPNGFNLDVWRPNQSARQSLRALLGIPSEALVIGYVARYHPMKDPQTFLTAMRRVFANYPNVHCVMVGRGNNQKNRDLAPHFQELPTERLHLLGERSDIPEIMSVFDAFCLSSSRSEAFPNVLGEAMACGIPCVSTDVGDARFIIGDTGHIVPCGEAEALAEALMHMIERLSGGDRWKHSQRVRARIGSEFGLQATVDHYKALYASLLEEKSQRSS